MADQHELGAVGDGVGRRGLLGPELAGVVPTEPFGVGTVHDREVQGLVEPPIPITDELRIDRETWGERVTSRLGDRAEPIEVGPRTFRVDVIGGHRRDATPVVDTRIEQRPEVVGQVRRSLQVHLGRQDQAGGRERPEVVVARARLHALHARLELRQEVLHDHLLHVAVLRM